ncbi:unnamed protein product [Penicillium salamii]|nr:unnamed protein product [Penicillium salamii]
MMNEVHQAMGLSGSMGDDLPTFSLDVLRLEIIGPHENHLSVIDVPGIFKTTTPGLTSKSDITLVREMVLNYMRNPRSIMLAVVPANVDIATQEIIELAREQDPDGTRTLRILTKPDLVDKGAEDRIVELVEGKQESQELGWVVVRNLGQKDLQDSSKDRDVRSEVSKRLKECKKDLESLGEERESPEQQRKYLLDIASKFQRITENALQTNYGSQDAFDEEPGLRLATLVANRNAQFSDDFSIRGHLYCFMSHGHDDDSENQPNTTATSPPSSVGACIGTDNEEAKEGREERESTTSRKMDSCSDIEDILHDRVQIQNSLTEGILPWIENVYQGSRGFELGTFNSSILPSVLKKQSAKWPSLAEGYICDIISMVHIFTSKALDISCGNQRLGQNILSFLMDGLIEKYRQALSMTDFLLRIEREGHQ